MAGKPVVLSIITTGVVLGAGLAYAKNWPNVVPSREKVELSIGSSYLMGQSHEYVFDATGGKISELIWDIQDTITVDARLSVRSEEGLGGRITASVAADGHGRMEDYDWLAYPYNFYDWTDLSVHDDTRLKTYTALDARVVVPILGHDTVRLEGVGGFSYRTMKWSAYGGDYVYTPDPSDPSTYRTDVGSIGPTVQGIDYEQTYTIPYAGLSLAFDTHRLSLRGTVTGSPAAAGEAIDNHWLTQFRYEDFASEMPAWSAEAELVLKLGTSLRVGADFRYEEILEGRGPTWVTDLLTGGSYLIPGDASGMDHRSGRAGISIGYKF